MLEDSLLYASCIEILPIQEHLSEGVVVEAKLTDTSDRMHSSSLFICMGEHLCSLKEGLAYNDTRCFVGKY